MNNLSQLEKMTGEGDAMRSRLVEIQSIAGKDEGSANCGNRPSTPGSKQESSRLSSHNAIPA